MSWFGRRSASFEIKGSAFRTCGLGDGLAEEREGESGERWSSAESFS
jgi:hypothetical protein